MAFSGWMTSLSPLTSTTVFSSSFCDPLADTGIAAGTDIDVIRTGNFDLLEIADLVVARDGRSAVFLGTDLHPAAGAAAATMATTDLRMLVS